MSITILLATYQGEKYLPFLLESLSCQTESRFQVLYQDDGSTDRTVSLLQTWSQKDDRFHPACQQGLHLGAVKNFFSLLQQSDSDLVLLCDQDDIWEANKVESLVQTYNSFLSPHNPNIPVMVHSDASIINENGQLIADSFFRLEGWDPRALQLNRLLVQNNATGCMMLLNRPLVNLITHYGDPAKMFMHDWFIALTAASFGKVIFLDKPLTRYRQHENNAIGASSVSLIRRGFRALRERDKAKARIALTYSHARAFREAYDGVLPPESAQVIDAYLSTQNMPKLPRILSVRSQGCLMQSTITRLGQFLFG